jgi:hypothetical protein
MPFLHTSSRMTDIGLHGGSGAGHLDQCMADTIDGPIYNDVIKSSLRNRP